MTRHFLGDTAPPRPCGYVGWRALIDRVPPNWPAGLVTESWARGQRFGIAPVEAQRTYWYASENAPRGWSVPPGARKKHLLQLFRGWHPPVVETIEATDEEAILLHEIADRPPLRRWHSHRVAVLGDAAHLMTPNLGQGAAMALEDAAVLADCIARFDATTEALANYQRLRKARADSISWRSHQLGNVIQLGNPLLWRIRNAALRGTPDWVGARSLSGIFNFRVESAGVGFNRDV